MTTINDPFYDCECRHFGDQVKKEIDELKTYVIMEMETKPKLVRKILEIISFKLDEEIVKAIGQLSKDCDDHGYANVLTPDEMGCEADFHHCLCG